MENETNDIDQEYVEPANWKTIAGKYSSYWD
jgi:hypothetical protein